MIRINIVQISYLVEIFDEKKIFHADKIMLQKWSFMSVGD